MNIKIGDYVRSHDFPELRGDFGRPACYIEGTVVGFQVLEGCERYVIKVERRVVSGAENNIRLGELVYPPVNGTPRLFGGTTDGVELLTAREDRP